MRHNRAALDNIKLMPRMLRDVSGRDPGITLFGKSHGLPLVIGPTGPAGFVWYRGETALARAAAKVNIPFTLATTSNTAMEKIFANGGGDAQGHQRGKEYDNMSGLFAEYIETEVLPRVEKNCKVKLTKDPEGRAAMGSSSGGSAALIMAWFSTSLLEPHSK